MSKKSKKLSPKKSKSGGTKSKLVKKSVKKAKAKKSIKNINKKKATKKSSTTKKKAKPNKVAATKKKTIKKASVKKAAKKAAKKVLRKTVKKPAKKIVAKKNNKPANSLKVTVAKQAEKVQKVSKPKLQEPKLTATPVKTATNTPVANPKVPASKPVKIIKAESLPVTLDLQEEKGAKEPPGKYEVEFPIHCSSAILYEFLSTPSGLSEWFCDDVNIKEGIYSFKWNDSVQSAKLLKAIPEKLIRFRWNEKNDGSYFEFRIERDELTNDISLIITDFALGDELNSSKLLWDSQVDKLLHVLGSFF